MMVPIRCFSCGKVVSQHYEEFTQRVEKGETPKKVLDDLGFDRYCCRRTIFSHVDLIDEIAQYNV
ncbi:MAG: DNA-directed RNA polymerase subunit N [Candidatus Diapherotrites archaeon]|nr:DNA-directed RNA polymerase subunit N [Candidatus Diapherotrites archaeon]